MSFQRHMISTCIFVSILFLVAPPLARAGDLKEQYKVGIVVHVEKHRLLTDIFREQVSRELRDGLEAALGDLAKVSIITKHPRLADIQTKGLGRALDGLRERGTTRTYFVTIDFNGTHYRIQTRMHDGLTGLPSPVVRQASIRDRAYVARTATFLLERDLGLLGTVISEPGKGRLVDVEMRGGGLGVDLGKWVKKGEVFALVKVEGTAVGSRLPWALLQVEEPPRNGVCRCKFFSRYQLDRVTGLRAVLLNTISGPLRLRLLEEKPNRELGPLQSVLTVQIRRNGFDESSRIMAMARRGRDVDTSVPLYKGKGTFDKIAFVSVLSDETLRARIPIPILDDRVIVIGVPPGNEAEDLITGRYRMLVRNVLDAYQVQSDMFRDINALIAKADQRVAAIARVKQTLERSRNDYNRLTEERDLVEKALAKLPPGKGKPTLAGINDRLKLLKAGEADLRKTISSLEKIEKEENDPVKKDWLLQKEKAQLLEADGELDKAIAIYEKAPEKFKSDELKKHLAGLKKLWEPANDEHLKARKFILDTYPGLTTEKLEKEIDEAKKALEVCKKENDVIGPVRMRKATLEHVKRMDTEASALNPTVNIEDDKPLKRIQELAPKLRKVVEEIGEYLEKKKR